MCVCVPVWMLVCSSRLLLVTKDFSQTVHWNLLRESCSDRCIFRLCLVAKLFPQTLQVCGLTPVWFSMWMRREYSLGRVLPQMSHTNSRLVRYFIWSSDPWESSAAVARVMLALWVFWCLWRAKCARSEAAYWNSLLQICEDKRKVRKITKMHKDQARIITFYSAQGYIHCTWSCESFRVSERAWWGRTACGTPSHTRYMRVLPPQLLLGLPVVRLPPQSLAGLQQDPVPLLKQLRHQKQPPGSSLKTLQDSSWQTEPVGLSWQISEVSGDTVWF